MAVLGAVFGALFSGEIADRYGRRSTIVAGDILMTIGSLMMAYAGSISMLVAGRIVVGLGFGAEATTAGIYLAEVSPRVLRGSIIACNIFFAVLGQFFALLICIWLDPYWRLMLGLAIVPALLQAILMICFMPETSHYLMR